MELNLGPWLKLLAGRDPTPAGGSLALVTLAGAAALASKCARLSGEPSRPFDDYGAAFERFAVEDCDAYAALVSGEPAAKEEAQGVSLRHLTIGLEFLEKTGALQGKCKPVLAPDLNAARGLAAAALEVLLANQETNVSLTGVQDGLPEDARAILAACRERLSRL